MRGKPGYGHCSAHQFLEGGCKDKANCHYWHMRPIQEGRFKHIRCPDTGKAPCPKFAKTGKCGAEGCQLAHIKVEGAMTKHFQPRSKGKSGVRGRVPDPKLTLNTVRVPNPDLALITVKEVDDPDPEKSVSHDDDAVSVLDAFIMGGSNEVIENDPEIETLVDECFEKSGVKMNLYFWHE